MGDTAAAGERVGTMKGAAGLPVSQGSPWNPVNLLRRVLPLQLMSIRPSSEECAEFNIAPERARTAGALSALQLLLWRRWLMVALVPVTLALAIWTTVEEVQAIQDLQDQRDESLAEPPGSIGRIVGEEIFTKDNLRTQEFLSTVDYLSRWATFVLVTLGLVWSTNWARSRRLLLAAWAAPYVAVLLVYSLPMKKIFSLDDVMAEFVQRIVDLISPGSGSLLEGIFDLFKGQLDEYWQYYLLAWYTVKVVGPSTLAVLPALARGAAIAKLVLPMSVEVGFLAELMPLLYLPLVGLVLIIIVQLSASYYVLVAIYSAAIGVILPPIIYVSAFLDESDTNAHFLAARKRATIIRAVTTCISVIFLIVFLATDDGKVARDLVYDLDAGNVIRAVLQGLVSFFILTMVGADYIMLLLFAINRRVKLQGTERRGLHLQCLEAVQGDLHGGGAPAAALSEVIASPVYDAKNGDSGGGGVQEDDIGTGSSGDGAHAAGAPPPSAPVRSGSTVSATHTGKTDPV